VNRIYIKFISVILFTLISSTLAQAGVIERYALIVGANDGGGNRPILRYANSDAVAFHRVLTNIGGIAEENSVVVLNSTKKLLDEGLADLKRLIIRNSKKSNRIEVVFYYSGHSNEQGLLLAENLLTYKNLKSNIKKLPGSVKIIVVDSCASGTLTMTKGGKQRPAFLVDSSTKTKGLAVITSASADEAAQESAAIRGSFFTHYMVSGMRGAADSNSDRKVTLSEAYRYSYNQTLARTENTRSGPQHPSYDFRLSGTGDLVLTDLRSSESMIIFDKPLSGKYFVRDINDNLVAEITKIKGTAINLGLEAGEYTILLEKDKATQLGTIDLAKGQKLNTTEVVFKTVKGEINTVRGDGQKEYKSKKAVFNIAPAFTEEKLYTQNEDHNFALSLIAGHSGKVSGVAIGGIAYVVEDDIEGASIAGSVNWNNGRTFGAQLAGGVNHTKLDMKGLQLAGFGNWAGSKYRGAQFAGGANLIEGNLEGFQGAGGVNWTIGEVQGAQAAAVNYSGSHKGAQIGIVNITDEIKGAQVGLVNNAGHVKGLQIGLINRAESNKGLSLGLVNLIDDGRKDLDLSIDELQFVHIAFKMGTDRFYTIYDFGSSVNGNSERNTAGLGLGIYAPFESAFINIEGVNHYITTNAAVDEKELEEGLDEEEDLEDSENFIEWEKVTYAKLSINVGYNVIDNASVWLGANRSRLYNSLAVTKEVLNTADESMFTEKSNYVEWNGYSAGIRYSFN
jgi:hypothetical protein